MDLINEFVGGGGGGQQQRPQGGNNAFGGNYPAGGGVQPDNEDYQAHAQAAANHAGSGDTGMFANVMGNVLQQKDQIAQGNIQENEAVQNHQQFFGAGGGNNQPADSHSMGSAAAVQALKMFTSGGGGGGQSQGAFMAMAMGEASKLFDQQASQGNVSGGTSKESVVQKAGEMALQMYLKSQGGNAGGLMSLASKFI